MPEKAFLKTLQKPLPLGGGSSLPVRALLAPMEGVMTPLLCATADSLDLANIWMAPFIAVSGGSVPSVSVLRKRLERFTRSGRPAIAQILGREPEPIAVCALRLQDAGFGSVNLNFACPSSFVVKGGGGGAMLKDPSLMAKTVAAVKAACGDGMAVSVKLRSGWSSPEEIEKTVPAVRDAGAAFAILHYRTVKEAYKDVPGSLDRIARAVTLAGRMPLFGNGDIRSVSDAQAMLSRTACAGVALARGFLSDPFLLRRVLGHEAPSVQEGRGAFLKRMVELAVAGEAPWVRTNFLEVARSMQGASSQEFKAICAASDEELLSGSFPYERPLP